jgi:outer membrane protein insertion porin family
MKKIIIISILSFLIIPNLKAEIIDKIIVNGSERVADETVLMFSGVNIKDNLQLQDLNDIIKNLYKTNFFSDISISFNNGELVINVIENPIIQTVDINGVKHKGILKVLSEQIILKEKTSYNESFVKIDEKKISNILRTSGYYFSEVKSKIKKNDNNTIDLIYEIDLGKKAHIKKIKFIGNKKIKDRKLKNIIVSEESKFWKFISKRKFLDINRIKLDEKLLKNYYKNNGYYNVKVESSSAQIIDEKNFELVFNINAGEKYFFNNLELIIPRDYTHDNFINISEALNKLKGKLYSLNKIEMILKEIDNIALTKQFEFINARYRESLYGKNKINLKIILEETEKYYVEKINIYGNYITSENVIRNKLIIDEGDAFNDILFNKSINEIKSTRIFKTVDSKISESSVDKKKVIDIFVEEMPTGEISAGAGTGTSGSVLSFGIKENNYLGKGMKLNTSVSITDDSLEGAFSINNPNYKNSDKSLNASFESSRTDLMSRYGYEVNKTGLSVGTSYEQFKDIYFSPSISAYYEKLDTSSKASASRKKQEGSFFESEFNYGLTLNKLNQNFQPTEGYKSSFYQTLPLISDDTALANSFDFSKYFQIKEEMIFSVSLLAMSVNSITGEDIRASKRIFLPGRRLRGFEIGKIGPVESGDYIGGNFGSAINFNATLPQLFPQLQNIDFSIFFDAANVWGVDYNESLDSSKVRSSTGLAVDWFTPIGPLSFSFSQPITKASSDVTESFRFNIGTSF